MRKFSEICLQISLILSLCGVSSSVDNLPTSTALSDSRTLTRPWKGELIKISKIGGPAMPGTTVY